MSTDINTSATEIVPLGGEKTDVETDLSVDEDDTALL